MVKNRLIRTRSQVPLVDVPCRLCATSRQKRPDFFVLGTRKGGTTAFLTYLTKHPVVYPYRIFGGPNDGEAFGRLGTEAYDKKFQHVPGQMLVGDSTVSRIVNDAHLLGRFYPETKAFVLLREPVTRCHSQMLMRARLGTNGMSMNSNVTSIISQHANEFERFAQNNPSHAEEINPAIGFRSTVNCLYEGAYVAHLHRLFHYISSSNVLIFFSEELFQNTSKIMHVAFNFLELDPGQVDAKEFSKIYNGRPREKLSANLRISASLRKRMEILFAPYDRQLEILLNRTLPWMNRIKL